MVIHESVHIVDDAYGWYLSDFGANGATLWKAERLAWAAQHLLVGNSGPLSKLRSFENYVYNGVNRTDADIQEKWGYVVIEFAGMPDDTYTYAGVTGALWTHHIEAAGWGDFYTKIAIRGLSFTAGVYMADINRFLGGNVSLTNTYISPGVPNRTYTIPAELW